MLTLLLSGCALFFTHLHQSIQLSQTDTDPTIFI